MAPEEVFPILFAAHLTLFCFFPPGETLHLTENVGSYSEVWNKALQHFGVPASSAVAWYFWPCRSFRNGAWGSSLSSEIGSDHWRSRSVVSIMTEQRNTQFADCLTFQANTYSLLTSRKWIILQSQSDLRFFFPPKLDHFLLTIQQVNSANQWHETCVLNQCVVLHQRNLLNDVTGTLDCWILV